MKKIFEKILPWLFKKANQAIIDGLKNIDAKIVEINIDKQIQTVSENQNIVKWGCNFTSRMNVFAIYSKIRYQIDSWYSILVKRGAMTEECYILNYNTLSEACGLHKLKYNRDSFDHIKLKQFIDKEIPVIVQIPTSQDSFHFVACYGYTESIDGLFFLIHDPLERDHYMDTTGKMYSKKKIYNSRIANRMDWHEFAK